MVGSCVSAEPSSGVAAPVIVGRWSAAEPRSASKAGAIGDTEKCGSTGASSQPAVEGTRPRSESGGPVIVSGEGIGEPGCYDDNKMVSECRRTVRGGNG